MAGCGTEVELKLTKIWQKIDNLKIFLKEFLRDTIKKNEPMDLRTKKELMSTIQNLARIGQNMDLSMTWSI